MYTPSYFSVPAKETLLGILPDASFVTVTTVAEDGAPQVTHLPVSYDPGRGDHGTIIGHMAKANPHCQWLEQSRSLVIFSGPHAYISPRDYASVVNVPTWNYVAVHASGRARILSGEADVIAVLKRLTAENEGDRANPWSLEEIEAKRISAMTKAIVAFEIPVDHLEAKAKLGQNKSAEDKQALVSASAGSDLEEWQNSIL